MSLSEMLDEDLGDVDLSQVRTLGRAGKKLPVPFNVRPLDADEVRAHGERESGIKATPLKRVSSRHRQLAKAIASGMPPGQAARMYDLSPSRVSILQMDPTFQDLVAVCRAEGAQHFAAFNERLAGLGEDAIEELRERLETEPAQFAADELIRISAMTADRTGFGPKKVEEKNINLNFGDQLSAARKRVVEAGARQIEAVIEEATIISEKKED